MEKRTTAILKHLITENNSTRKEILFNLDHGDNEQTFTFGSEEYLVLTEEEADERVREEILESVWAFNLSFLNSHARDGVDFEDMKDFQESKCEEANKTFLALIKDVDHFVDDAIMADGRGHFISGYDGAENEVKIRDTYFFIYRIN